MDSSRIFVRGLPPKFSEDDFRKHFAKFPVTDAKHFPHRRFGYVGYKTPEDAAKAVKYFNKSFIRMSKLAVEIARPISDETLPRSRRQAKEETNSLANSDYVPPAKENALKRKRVQQDVEQDPKLKEFLDVMQPPSKVKSWANEQARLDSGLGPAAEPIRQAALSDGKSDDEYQVITKKPKTLDSARKPSAEPSALLSAIETQDANDAGLSESEVSTEPARIDTGTDGAPVSDADWLRSRTKRVLDLVEDEEGAPQQSPAVLGPSEPAAEEEDEGPEGEVDQAVDASHAAGDLQDVPPSEEDRIRQTGRLYLRNLPYVATEDNLREHFSKHGSLEEVHVPVNNKTGSPKGFAFLQFKDPEHAVEAFKHNDGIAFQGRLLHIISAKLKRDSKLDEFAISKLPLKKQREIRKKTEAASSTFNWNSLYLNADAVMSTVADRMGISKAELLDPTSSDAAVKQAHAETHIIQETKTYFAQHGVDLEAFKRSSKGDIAILVKNIPHGIRSDEVQKLFEEHGTVKQFLMPPAGMTAIVEFANSAQAKSAFKSLAYRKVKDSILFLEKAPKDLFKEGVVAPSASVGTKSSATDLLQDAVEPELTTTSTLYVRNLNFSTTTQHLSEIFARLAGFRSAKVKTKNDPKRGTLSMGFGFVEFNGVEAASAALRAMDGYNLDGHKLQIKASHKGADAAEERRKEDVAKKAAGTKIIIKNLPFEASKKDIRALFAPYGQLRSVRVPKKFDSSSRGFGFADFTTKREAANAMDALRNTHLLGRRLVLAFTDAEADDPEKELEKMQQKIGSQANKVALQHLTGGGRKKFNVAGNDNLDET
ncbi:RNA-binding domain-containing protein [Lindgomyces ingoldianus]|uniref:RNA-binding domain-containing protein n=1 Tax=Lindgomyces ingoldianus TaxID=673940 RepID=A0ACB6RC89_9PLEO|nr:RNA-binding domain-containing protein [Lindgomyces ingoldianus]KAF2476142.1 RNA-binding domain-containing protein [Lindgomyces ingoldianus]